MKSFMVVATFKAGTNMADVLAVVPEEQARIRELQTEGRISSLYLATAARQTVFLESFGDDIDHVVAMVTTLPMARWWDLDVFPLNPPAGSQGAT
jgi:muconolactone delta-isomerase